MPYVITDECVACGTCMEECPNDAIVEGEGKYEITDECTECGTCIDVCPVGAIVEE
ncbi:MAG: 4Fe-4S binding protein [bacterium]|nr:4Fe-4S binding protein [bacterium]